MLDELEKRVPTFVIVANASGALGFRKVGRGAIPLLGELLGLLQVKDVLYDNGTSVRRKALVGNFDRDQPPAHSSTSPAPRTRLPGTRHRTDPRIGEALAYIERWGRNDNWQARARAATAVGTTLWPVGTQKTRNVIECAYVQTVVNLYVKHVIAELPEPPSW